MDKPETLFDSVIQIGIVVSDVNKAIEGYRDLLQVRKWNINQVDTVTGKGGNFHKNGKPIQAKVKIAWVNIGSVELELIEPQDQHSLYADFLKEHGPGIHHVMLGTADYDRCLDHMGEQKVTAIGGGELQDTRFQMFDTQDLLGFICEIADGDPLVPDQTLDS
jgi:catechol 2,3-dioxygenase-like lactoylglutathione lyase family enzyme